VQDKEHHHGDPEEHQHRLPEPADHVRLHRWGLIG
jgi:hypothetical protein